MSTKQKYFGKYRGTVVNNIDPMQIGRLQVMVPDVSNVMLSSWAMPCTPVAGINSHSLDLDGLGDYVEIAHHASLNAADGSTISLWVKPRTYPGFVPAGNDWSALLSKGLAWGDENYSVGFGAGGGVLKRYIWNFYSVLLNAGLKGKRKTFFGKQLSGLLLRGSLFSLRIFSSPISWGQRG